MFATRTGAGAWLASIVLGSAAAQTPFVYLHDLGPESAVVAWGTAHGGGNVNTIGRGASATGSVRLAENGNGAAVVQTASGASVILKGLAPDTVYSYCREGAPPPAPCGKFRTWPRQSATVRFFVIGDYGSGTDAQRRVAGVMIARAASGDPVRFVLTTGDNIYGDAVFKSGSGDRDQHWEEKFFVPYAPLLSGIPFFPTLGNHDGNESERTRDREVYLDNFAFPGNRPAAYYTFSFGGLVDFFALDSTENTASGESQPQYAAGGAQHTWLREALSASRAPWKVAYFHHPPFSAGPRHEPKLAAMRHIIELLDGGGVQVVFNGHEHNFQICDRSEFPGPAQYFVSGAGGELRTGKPRKQPYQGWAPATHFLDVTIDGGTMRILPVGADGRPLDVRGPSGAAVKLPWEVRR